MIINTNLFEYSGFRGSQEDGCSWETRTCLLQTSHQKLSWQKVPRFLLGQRQGMGRVMFIISMFQCFNVLMLSCRVFVCMFRLNSFCIVLSNCMYRHLDSGINEYLLDTYIAQRSIPLSLLSLPLLSYTPSPFYYLYQPILPLTYGCHQMFLIPLPILYFTLVISTPVIYTPIPIPYAI